jgi:heptaprenyl diphosphate synthase
MQLQDDGINKTKKTVFIALLLSLALVLSYMEQFIPIPVMVPGVKLGLANIVTLTGLYYLSFKECFTLVILRVVLNSFFTGNVVSTWYSLSGGVLSFFVMFLLVWLLRNRLSNVFLSITGALFHNIGQLIVVAIITKSSLVALGYFPVLAVSAVIGGTFTGLCVERLLGLLNRNAFLLNGVAKRL